VCKVLKKKRKEARQLKITVTLLEDCLFITLRKPCQNVSQSYETFPVSGAHKTLISVQECAALHCKCLVCVDSLLDGWENETRETAFRKLRNPALKLVHLHFNLLRLNFLQL